LKVPNDVIRAARPCLNKIGMQLMSPQEAVKGAATEASLSLRLTPTLASYKAAQSFAPSPHIIT